MQSITAHILFIFVLLLALKCFKKRQGIRDGSRAILCMSMGYHDICMENFKHFHYKVFP